jgi:hypothetical protein
MRVAKLAKAFEREKLVTAFDFLKAQDVGPRLAQEASDEIEAQANGIDVPGAYSDCHGTKKAPNSGEGWALLRFHACVGREADAERSMPSARRGGTTDGDWHQSLYAR